MHPGHTLNTDIHNIPNLFFVPHIQDLELRFSSALEVVISWSRTKPFIDICLWDKKPSIELLAAAKKFWKCICLHIIYQQWNSEGSLNCPSRKPSIYLSCMINIMTADELVTPEVKASVGMILTEHPWNIPLPKWEELTHFPDDIFKYIFLNENV